MHVHFREAFFIGALFTLTLNTLPSPMSGNIVFWRSWSKPLAQERFPDAQGNDILKNGQLHFGINFDVFHACIKSASAGHNINVY